MRRDLSEAIASVRIDNRRDLAEAIAAARQDNRRDLAEMTTTLRTELRAEIRASEAETRRHFDVVAESLRSDIRLIAEGHGVLAESIDRLRQDMDQRFRGVDAAFGVVHLALADV